MTKNPLLTLAALLLAVLPLRAAAPTGAMLMSAKGPVTVTVNGKQIEAVPPMALPPGAKIETGLNGSAVVSVFNGPKMGISESSVYVFESASSGNAVVQLIKGTLTSWIRHMGGDHRLSIRTTTSVVNAHEAVVTVSADGVNTVIDVFTGSASLTDRMGRRTDLTRGQRTSTTYTGGVTGTNPLAQGTQTPDEPGVIPTSITQWHGGTKTKSGVPLPGTDSETSPETGSVQPSPTQELNTVPVSPSAP